MLRHIIATSLAAICAIENSSAQSLYELVRKIENPKGPIDGSGDEFGISLAQVDDYLVVGAYRDDTGAENAGAAYAFSRDGNLITTIHNPTPEADDWFAFEVGTVEDRIIIPAESDSSAGPDSGSVYLFDAQGELMVTIPNPTPAVDDDFGNKVLGIGNDILVGAWGDDTMGSDAGAAYLFNLNGTLLQEFYSPNPLDFLFGRSLAKFGEDKVLIGSRARGGDEQVAGAAYLFDLQGNLLQTFFNPNPTDADLFGFSPIALGDDRVVVSAYQDTFNDVLAGSVYIFDTDGNLLETIHNPSPEEQDWFGRVLAPVGEDRFMVSAVFDNTAETRAGAVYLYDIQGDLLETFLPPEPVASGHFGLNLATLDELLVIGSHFDGGGFTGPGAVYLYAPVASFLGDFNGDLAVDQGDLDLVLLHWGDDATTAPDGWTTDLPSGLVDQDELDKVLLNWGATRENPATASIPEPRTYYLMLVAVVALMWGRTRRPEPGQPASASNFEGTSDDESWVVSGMLRLRCTGAGQEGDACHCEHAQANA